MNAEPYILPFTSLSATLEAVGGKGANLARLGRSGYPVPGGFLVTTAAYRLFTAANGLEPRLPAILARHAQDDLAGLEAASAEIRSLFEAGAIPPQLAQELCAAYRESGAGPVAVRSSATAEDLPDLSFAGQQETYLNVLGEEALLKAVVRCWASLWTGRAIGYRARQGIPAQGLALAVVVQRMVPSQSSGVLFTANPLSGLRSQVVIDATLGLGEALVSGQVEPDHYVVDMLAGVILEKTLGAKALSIRPQAGGGTLSQAEDAAAIQALPDEQIVTLARLGKQVEADYGFPQDIEWAWADGKLSLLQSRPITSLFPLPQNGAINLSSGAADGDLRAYFSFGAVQGMLDPITPLGGDAIRAIFITGAHLFHYQSTLETHRTLMWAGERVWVDFTTILRNSVGRGAANVALGIVEPSTRQALLQVWDDPAFVPQRKGISFGALRHMSHFFPRVAFNMLLNLAAPEKRRVIIVNSGERVLAETRRVLEGLQGSPRARLLRGIEELQRIALKKLPGVFPLFISGVAAGMAPFNALNQMAKSLPRDPGAAEKAGWEDLALEVTRGIPHNPTTEMDLELWQTAQAIRRDPASLAAFQASAPEELARQYKSGGLSPAAQAAIERFMERYGSRGLAEIDLGRPRWREDATHVIQVIGSYLQIEDEALAPTAVFERGAQNAVRAVNTLATRLRPLPGGWLKARLARAAARRVRALLGLREAPKFFAVRMIGIIRKTLLEIGSELVQAGELEQADDLVYLYARELQAFGRGEQKDWKRLVAERRVVYARELKRRQIPRLLLSDGRAFYEGMDGGEGEGTMLGSPVSPGAVEGAVRVIFDPRGAQLQPGEILVCPGTDPSWTPLFLAAGGLVMEVGGMMTHGAVVAREYGIPAVVGVHQATIRLVTGQRIRLDGSSGVITLLEPA